MVTRYTTPPERRNRGETPAAAGLGGGAPGQSAGAGDGPFSSLESIDIRLRPSASGWQADIRYHRPDVTALACGQDSRTAGDRLGRVHSYCGYAHETAFARAVESASGIAAESAARRAARDLQLMIEQALAHGRRAALELAPAGGEEPPVSQLAALLGAAEAVQQAIGMAGPNDRIAPDSDRLAAALDLLAARFDALLAASPKDPPEARLNPLPSSLRESATSGWQRPWHFLESAWPQTAGLSRRLEPEPAQPALAHAEGTGSGTASTSRGQLTYFVTLRDGLVESCRSATPTARLTAGDGALARQLAVLPNSGDVLDLAQFVVLAHDPCAPTTIALAETTHG